ncbi:hypothetical protein [Streptomyces uncialis]|uniref:DUF7927 domain-containing protein n=1 Tax=Streptomyces uncialis TaxID=1048205 RepID=UPI00386DA4CE|nr:DUF11 domain-containing protein [Streptomyces uncialis]
MAYRKGTLRAAIRRRGTFAALAAFALVAGLLMPAMTAQAAPGTAVLDVSVEAVDPTTGAPQTQAAFGTHGNSVAYKVGYSCAASDCVGATVRMSPSQPDPYGLSAAPLLSYTNWTPPAGLPGASVGGTDATGRTITLGDLTAGRSGTFLVVYTIASSGSYTTPKPAQYYPSGFSVRMSATMDATSAVGPATADAAPVTWTSSVPSPSIAMASPGSVRPGTNVSWNVSMGTGSFARISGSVITGTSQWIAAGNYTVVEKLDPRAVYVSSSGGGVYDRAAHSITWSLGTKDAPVATASGGWGWAGGGQWTSRAPYTPRSVTVNYPVGGFTSDPGGCNFEERVTTTAEVTATYLDPERTTRSASSTMSHTVSCHDPFPRADVAKDSTNSGSSGAVRLLNVPPDVTGLTCPSGGRDDWNRVCAPGSALAPFADSLYSWSVVARNQSNAAGVAVIEDDTLGQPDAPVDRITTTSTTPAATIAWTLNNGTSGTSDGTANAPPGTWYTKARITSGTLAPPNIRPGDTGSNGFGAYFSYPVKKSAPIGERRTNTATATMSWPGSGLDPRELGPVSRTVQFRAYPKTNAAKPAFAAAFATTPVTEGGGNAVPGKKVTFSLRGATSGIPADADITPQYVFLAPAGWTVDAGSASFPAGSVPDGVVLDHTTKTVGGVSREAVVATWPGGVSFGENTTWPNMTVAARPGFGVTAGTRSTATAWAGDSRHTWTSTGATYANAVQDAPDIDGDGSTDEWFSSAAQNVTVSSADGLSAVKEICLPTPGAPDGCAWLSDPDQLVGVAPTATDIRYRVTLKNTGNTTLSEVVAYDVLPHTDDRGTSAGTASTPRGSTFDETLDSVPDISANLRLEYSASTNPARPEVNPAAPGTTDDWGPGPAGKKAIRATVTGDLAPGQEAAFVFVAAVAPGTEADAVACNSVALDSRQTLPSEPRPVCAATQEADLEAGVPERLPLQVGRPGVLPFTVTHGGGSRETSATVTVEVPAGLTVDSLTPQGWTCTAEPGSAPLDGPLTLTCAPVDDDGEPRPLRKGVTTGLDVPVTPTTSGRICVPASVTGPMHDPRPANNEATGCVRVGPATAGLALTKTDGRDDVAVGEEYGYTLEAANLLPAEPITGATLTDTLPDGLEFVSATDGGTVSGQGDADAFGNRPGGTVTWTLGDLGRAGVPSPDGDRTTGGTGATATVEVRVRVLPGARGAVVNSARVTAPDPADSGRTLTADASDTDAVRALTLTKVSGIPSAGVSAGDTVTYTVTATNSGTADHTLSTPAVLTDHLDGVLDDASFVAGSASVTTGGGPSEPLPDPSDGVLRWAGALAVGDTVTLTYRVRVDGDGDHTLRNTAYGAGEGTVCDSTAGRDEDGVPCATTTDGFAPLLAKSVRSAEQRDDGRWTVVYGLEVTNPDPDRPARYDLADDLRPGAGIDVTGTRVSAPDGVTGNDDWNGTGELATDVELPGGATHEWAVTVTADAHGTAGAAPGLCVDGAAGGFANRATLTLTDGSRRTADSCAAPAKPTVTKTVDGAPRRNADGTWDIGYVITVTNESRTAAGGLVHKLDDTLSFPRGVRVLKVTADSGGATMNPRFNGGLTKVGAATVTPDTALFSGTDRVPAATGDGPGTREYRVTVTARSDAMHLTAEDVACGPQGGRGYGNSVSLTSTDTVVGRATACAAITVPKLHFTKTADTSGPVHPGDTVTYTVTARNVGDADFVAGDPAGVEDDMSDVLTHTRFNGDAKATAGKVVIGDARMLWSTPVRAGGTETLTYSVTVKKVTGEGARIVNGLSRIGVTPDQDPGPDPTPTPGTNPSGGSTGDLSGTSSGGNGSGGGSGSGSGGGSGSGSGGASGGSGSAGSANGGSGEGGSGSGAAGVTGSAGGRPGECPARASAVPGQNCVVTTAVTPKPSSWLASTGSDLVATALVAGTAFLGGAALLITARRRAHRARP